MKNRDKLITIAFLAFILVIPAVSIVRNCLPKEEQSQLTEAQKAVLEQNGTMKADDENTSSDTDTQTQDEVDISLQSTINTFTDGLFGRTKLIAFNTSLTSLISGGTYIESTQTLMGKNNMFFYKTETDGHPLWDYMGINRFTDDELKDIADNLTYTKQYLNGLGMEFYVLCMPNKEIVYEENMPDTVSRVNSVSRGEQLDDYIDENTEVVFVYPKDELIAAKDEAQLYYLTDTHCNQKGSFVAMQALFNEVYGTSRSLDTVDFRTDMTDYAGDLVTIAGIADKYSIDNVYAFKKDTADTTQYHDQTLLFVGDSFGGFLSVIAEGYYSEVYWVMPSEFDYSMYEKYSPDVVIWERAERYCETFGEALLTQ